MNFDLDDPLAGILSDGSDDSFFDDDILGKKKPAKKSSTPTAAKKSVLFDLDTNNKPNVSDNKILDNDIVRNTTKIGATALNTEIVTESEIVKPISPAPNRSAISKESNKTQQVDFKIKPAEKIDIGRSPAKSKLTKSADKLDFFDDLGIEPKKETAKPLEKGLSSQSLLDDILGGPSTKPIVPNQRKPTTAINKQDFDLDSLLGKSEPKQISTTHKNVAPKSLSKPDTPKEPQVKKKTSDDWLGVFQNTEEIVEEDEDTDMPAWLVGGDSKKKKNTANAPKQEPKTNTIEKVAKPEKAENDTYDNKEQHEANPDNKTQVQLPRVINPPLTNKLDAANEDVAMEGAALYLQEQESQIMVALQLKAQDEKLASLQARQKESQRVHREAAQAQREQIDSLLQRQAEHRRQMQAVIAAHQERITQRIKTLLSVTNEDSQDANEDGNYETPTEERISPYMKEKKQLLQLIQSLQENHDKEIDLMETSYRRQLAFVEVSFNQAEERMKEESDKLVKFYMEKISWVDEHHQLFKKLSEDNLNSLMERHKAENEMLQHQHLDNIRVLQEHHTTLIENIKNAVKQEQVLIKDSAGFSSELNELLVDVKDNKLKCQELIQKIEALTQNTQQNAEKSVQLRETQISDMLQQLKIDRENFEKEKSESKNLVHMLEARLKQMTMMIEEESSSLKQKKMEFEFEKATFSKQTEFAKNILKKQDEEIKMLKETIQKEYQEKIARIEEEKAAALKDSATIAKEKASIQSLKLDLEKTRAELQAQLDEVTAERSKLNVEKQELQIEEQRVLAKSRDLDILAKSTMDKQAQAEKKYSEAEFAQHKYEERIRRIQEHVVSLNAREKQIAREKVALSRERLSIHNERKQLESRQQCSLCRNTQYNDTYTLPETYMNPSVSRDYNAIPINVEQEMANLMGRAFKLRYTADDNVNYQERPIDPNEFESATRSDSGAFKDYMDPKLMMLRLDVQQVISNLDQSKKGNVEQDEV